MVSLQYYALPFCCLGGVGIKFNIRKRFPTGIKCLQYWKLTVVHVHSNVLSCPRRPQLASRSAASDYWFLAINLGRRREPNQQLLLQGNSSVISRFAIYRQICMTTKLQYVHIIFSTKLSSQLLTVKLEGTLPQLCRHSLAFFLPVVTYAGQLQVYTCTYV